jgi:hypothetical protein
LRWVEVVEVDVAADEDLVVWVAPRPPDRAATVSVPVVGTQSRTSSVSLVTRKSVPSAARR